MGKSVKNRHDKYGTFVKICGVSDKKDKRLANRKFRRYSKIDIYDPENDNIVHDLKEVSDVYDFNSDGLAVYINFSQRSKWCDEPYSEYDKIRFRRK